MTNDTVIIFSSSRSHGNTRKAVDALFPESQPKLIDLNKKNISFFDYNGKKENDDFLPLIEEILKYKTFIFASPTYWYSMCAQMKTFFDRLSELYSSRTDLLKALEGKNVFVITSYAGIESPCFEDPFKLTSNYLKMNYHCCHFEYSGNNEKELKRNKEKQKKFLNSFKEKISS